MNRNMLFEYLTYFRKVQCFGRLKSQKTSSFLFVGRILAWTLLPRFANFDDLDYCMRVIKQMSYIQPVVLQVFILFSSITSILCEVLALALLKGMYQKISRSIFLPIFFLVCFIPQAFKVLIDVWKNEQRTLLFALCWVRENYYVLKFLVLLY